MVEGTRPHTLYGYLGEDASQYTRDQALNGFFSKYATYKPDVIDLFFDVANSQNYAFVENRVQAFVPREDLSRWDFMGSLLNELMKHLTFAYLDRRLSANHHIVDHLQTMDFFRRLHPNIPTLADRGFCPRISGIVNPDLMVFRETGRALQLTEIVRVSLAEPVQDKLSESLQDPAFLFSTFRNWHVSGSIELTRKLREAGVDVPAEKPVIYSGKSRYKLTHPRLLSSATPHLPGTGSFDLPFGKYLLDDFAAAIIIDNRIEQGDAEQFANSSAPTGLQSGHRPHPA
jgi:hypothetical protein